jgi:hypothetical protein
MRDTKSRQKEAYDDAASGDFPCRQPVIDLSDRPGQGPGVPAEKGVGVFFCGASVHFCVFLAEIETEGKVQ